VYIQEIEPLPVISKKQGMPKGAALQNGILMLKEAFQNKKNLSVIGI
jgi:hypothetical protein